MTITATITCPHETISCRSTIKEKIKMIELNTKAPEYTLQGKDAEVNDQTFSHSSEAIQYLQKIAGPYAIGRDIHVGDTIIGIKGRVGFEAAAPMVILKAHHALEKHVLTKWQLNLKDQLSQFYGNWLHEGQIMDPAMRDIEAFFESTQQQVTGEVFVQLMPYRFMINGIESAYDLMSNRFGSYGEMNSGWSGEDVRGFTTIFGNQTSIYHLVKADAEK
jgi:argininosuccinate synthase